MVDQEEKTVSDVPAEETPPQESLSEQAPEEEAAPQSEPVAEKEEMPSEPIPETEEAPISESIPETEDTPSEPIPEAEESTSEKEESPSEEEAPEKEEAPAPETEAAHVDFDLLETEGRWLLKVISGPNTGAEFAMHSGSSYLLGTDTKECDIVFQDLSVSRKHARLTIDPRENATLEDLGSRNGTYVSGEKITKKDIAGNVLVTIGTTSFMLYDREAEHTTIIAPTTQSKKDESKEEGKEEGAHLGPIQEAVFAPLQSEVERLKERERMFAKTSRAISSLIILGIVTGLVLLVGVGMVFLFHTEEVSTPKVADPEVEISRVLANFPAIRYSYNPTNNRLLLIGHVLTTTDRQRLLDSLSQLKFLRDIDYSSVVINELVWRETNQLLSKNPAWAGITITSPTAGKFMITGLLKTSKQANELFDYLSLNFPYMDLLEKKVIIEEDLLNQIKRELSGAGFRGVMPTLANGDLTLTGNLGEGTGEKFQKLVTLFKSLPGIRNVNLQVSETGQKEAFVDLTDKYRISGFAKSGKKSSVVINGRILGQGDILDGMLITDVTATTVFLEKDGIKYKIEFNQ
jgi:type III secretion system YscD/HrpQ family protein